MVRFNILRLLLFMTVKFYGITEIRGSAALGRSVFMSPQMGWKLLERLIDDMKRWDLELVTTRYFSANGYQDITIHA